MTSRYEIATLVTTTQTSHQQPVGGKQRIRNRTNDSTWHAVLVDGVSRGNGQWTNQSKERRPKKAEKKGAERRRRKRKKSGFAWHALRLGTAHEPIGLCACAARGTSISVSPLLTHPASVAESGVFRTRASPST